MFQVDLLFNNVSIERGHWSIASHVTLLRITIL